MTMNTRVHIAKPVNPETLFLRVLAVLESDPRFMPSWDKPADEPFRAQPGPLSLGRATYRHVRKGEPWRRNDGEVICHAQTGVPFTEDESEYRSTVGQGLAAIWEVTYAEDGPLEWPGHYDDEDDEPAKDYGNTAEPMPFHLVSANFDTAYGYKAINGAGCADLHAFLLREIGTVLNEQGVEEWVWLHEEKGTWHGPDEWALRGDADHAAANFAMRAFGGREGNPSAGTLDPTDGSGAE